MDCTERAASLRGVADQLESSHDRVAPFHVVLSANSAFNIVNYRKGIITELIRRGNRVTVISPADQYVTEIRAMGCNYIELKFDPFSTSLIKEILLFKKILRILKKLKPQVVLSYTVKNNVYSGIACRILCIPFVPNVTGLGRSFDGTRFLKAGTILLYRTALKRAKKVFFQNKADLALFTDAGICQHSQAQLLPGSGINLEHFSFRPLDPAPNGAICFLQVSRLLWEKGVGQFVEAARVIRQQYPQAKFKLLGAPQPSAKGAISQEQIDAWVSEGSIEYCGAVRDVRPIIAAAHCVVLPSYYREGTPRVILEGGSIGRPVIASNIPGCREAVIDNETGYLVAPRDSAALIAACLDFLSLAPDKRADMGARGRKHMVQNYADAIVTDFYMHVLAELTPKNAD